MSELNAKHMLHSYICSCLNHASECCNSNCECHKTSTDDIVTRLRQKYSGQLPICSEAAYEIERLREMCEQFASCAKSFGTQWGSDVVDFRINEKKFRKTWEKYKGGAW